ncbi:MAG: UDP-N-acetylmuramoyl-tripeptide--D-alanyl-D-alanine ligase [Actinomycetia bacterium]|nr:UDP-N-acetylmuramoyl-tripeptide--D-alanyl-D-alanine ligase [Actinomycetes bacterium]
MFPLTATEIARICGGRLLQGDAGAVADRVTIDSRASGPGALFAAFVGERVDGHDYLKPAFEAGASVALISDADKVRGTCILVDDVAGALGALAAQTRERLSCPVIAITGSSGKTTTKELLASVLATGIDPSARVVATSGNQNNELGVPLTLLAAGEDTQALIVELGMRAAGEIAALADLVRPRIGIITSIGRAHLETLGSLDAIAAAKAELLSALPGEGLALYPDDTGYDELLRSATTAKRTQTVGAGADADYRALDIDFDEQGRATARVQGPDSSFTLHLALPGRHLLSDALLVVACAHELGMGDEAIARALAGAPAVDLRGAVVEVAELGIRLIDETYNANPDSVEAALRTLALRSTRGRRIAVLGDMLELGDASEPAHRRVIELAAELDECLFVFGSCFSRVCAPHLAYDDIALLIRALRDFVRPGDLVLVKGSRGMRMERVVEALKEGGRTC